MGPVFYLGAGEVSFIFIGGLGFLNLSVRRIRIKGCGYTGYGFNHSAVSGLSAEFEMAV